MSLRSGSSSKGMGFYIGSLKFKSLSLLTVFTNKKNHLEQNKSRTKITFISNGSEVIC